MCNRILTRNDGEINPIRQDLIYFILTSFSNVLSNSLFISLFLTLLILTDYLSEVIYNYVCDNCFQIYNEIPGVVHRSPGIYLTAEENPGNLS